MTRTTRAAGDGGIPPVTRESRPGSPPQIDALTPAALQHRLGTAIFGHRVFYYPEIGSTNDRALELAAAGEPEGALVLAERQTRGRGRRDRAWASPAWLGIYTSVLLRPRLPANRAPLFTLMAAVATALGLRKACGLNTGIKWPNDIVVGHRKIAGILGEVRGSDPRIHEMVVGIGVNVNHEAHDFPPELSRLATSVRMEVGSPRDRLGILAEILEQFERRYSALLRQGSDELLAEWRTLSTMPAGARLAIETSGGAVEGSLQGIDDEGALMLADSAGRTMRVPFGEIESSLRPLE